MTMALITPAEARRRLNEGSAVLIDIREPMEHAREAIPGAKLCPLSRLDSATLSALAGRNAPAIIFHCQGGRRTQDNADRLQACSMPQAYMLEGGLAGWKSAGYPTRVDRTQPIELQRQVQIAAGSLILLGVLLSWLVSPFFVALSAFVGGGLVFAGISGWCGMAHLLAVLPWNRKSA
jgi:rhodanese-related sulfurtransferase